ncbi:MAG: CusA/CzcA family heavy metal efflux RND transporter [endosymbiont of Galathealinum brachiosum]|uniref:CusA/CzcA family heavy metal efflux RND transporter n=1 Tax=endosymbiont of Galathealinum brachiosum TaxID=2200906 RepID=A0A370DPD8_9GAMM|nr:MAG: CusA/CzcA family heavy metal efflux RND transporter [endosymbiont of Galathealinum brachiosum]
MIRSIIRWSIENRPLILLMSLIIAVWGVRSLSSIPLDAVPDLSDTQVIIKTSYPGQAPQIIEDQVTYPITSTMLTVPGATTVRGYSFFGDSYVYVLFDEDVDPYWARSRVSEYLNEVEKTLPDGAKTSLGPDASGVGWVYEYALIDKTGQHDLGELRSIQDWFLKFELESVPGVAEIASLGGMVKQYQVIIDPNVLHRELVTLSSVISALKKGNQESGASVIEVSEAEYMIRVHGYLSSKEDIGNVGPLGVNAVGEAVFLRDIAQIREGPAPRRGVAELDGKGEVVGGIVIMRWEENALDTIRLVEKRIEELKLALPEGVELIETYNRADLIQRSIESLSSKLIEEIIVVILVCVLFLMHVRSSLVIAISLPVGILSAFILMKYQGINANIMSLGGIAIAIGAMLDASIVMIENIHKHLELNKTKSTTIENRVKIITNACVEVGPPLFYSLIIITLSFLPVFALEAQEGRMFSPLAFTKTYAMAAAAGLSITLVPVLAVYFIHGRIKDEHANPVNRLFTDAYRPNINRALNSPQNVIFFACVLLLTTLWPLSNTGSEFMPELDEGDLLYMPTTLPGISIGKGRELLQQTDRLILTVPEVKQVFGKIGRAETATDPAPLNMLETTIQLKPREEWRDGMTIKKIKAELDARVKVPGLVNAWLMPIEARIDMLATGVKTPVGIRVTGSELKNVEEIAQQIETLAKSVNGTTSVIAERISNGRYIDITIDRFNAGQQLFNVGDLQKIISTAVGGVNITETVEGRERYPINIRYPYDIRNSISKLNDLPIVTKHGDLLPLSEFAAIKYSDGPAMIKSENGRLSVNVYIDIINQDLGAYVDELKSVISKEVILPPGYSLSWAGKFEYYERVKEKLIYIIPLTLIIIFILLYLSFKNITESLIVMLSVPFALVGGAWLLYAYQINLSVAVVVGFIALSGVATEFGIVMLIYLKQAISQHKPESKEQLKSAVLEGALKRVRPKTMTVAVIIGGLLPVLLGEGSGLEVMRPIAVPMVGGMITAPLVSMFLLPVVFYLYMKKTLKLN